MFHLEHTFLEFIEALEASKSLSLNKEGFWCLNSGMFQGLKTKLFPTRQLKKVTEACIDNFKRIERVPLDLKSYQEVEHLSYLMLARYLERKLRIHPEFKDLLKELMRHRVGFEYRFGLKNGGASRLLMGYVEFRLLIEMASQWKKKQSYFRLDFLTQHDEDHLKLASQYPLFVDLILEFPDLRNQFFNWIIRDNNPADVFIEFPAIADLIIHSDLSYRLGRIGDLLRLEKIGNERHVTIKFEGKRESVLNLNKIIEFCGGYRLTVKEVFAIFAKKFYQVGNLEVFKEGIINWNTFRMGHWDESLHDYVVIDFVQDLWWKHLPLFETLSKPDAENRYEISIDGNQWVVAAHATRRYINLSYERTHALLEVAIPDGDGGYRIFDFGKYGVRFPKNYLEGLKMFTETMRATVMYPDENVYYSFRQHGYYPLLISEEQGKQLMYLIREEIMNCFAGRRVYQIESENCAKWTYEIIEKVVGKGTLPNLYRMPLLDCEPGGAIQKLFTLIKKLPRRLHAYVITRLHYPIGAWRGIWIKSPHEYIWKSLSNHEFFDSAEVYLPALVIQKRREKLFDIQSAHLENKTLWELICEKIFYHLAVLPSTVGLRLSRMAYELLIYMRQKLATQKHMGSDFK